MSYASVSKSQPQKAAVDRKCRGSRSLVSTRQRVTTDVKPGTGFPIDSLPIQTKLKLGSPNDKYEQEADRVAQQVMRMPESQVQRQFNSLNVEGGVPMPSGKPAIQRLCTACEDEKILQPKRDSRQAAVVTPTIQTGISRLHQSGGMPLPNTTRNFMEPRFGHDFSQVRIHAGAEAAQLAHSLKARAFTVGRNIVFGKGALDYNSSTGKSLLAHELTHYVQQTANGTTISPKYDSTLQGKTIQRKVCDPLVQDCPAGTACYPMGSTFECLEEASTKAKIPKDPLCSSFDFNSTKGLVSTQAANYIAAKNIETRLTLVRSLKWMWRCATPSQQKQVRTSLSAVVGKTEAMNLWTEAGTPFGGYTGAYPSYASDIQKHLNKLGARETVSIGSFELTAEGSKHRRRAKRSAGKDTPDLGRTDIVYFRGHQFAQYKAPGLFSNGSEEKGFDLRYIEKVGGFQNVKLMISTSCATLCSEAFNVFHGLFPNAVILGYRKSAPLDGRKVRNSLQSKIKGLGRPLLLSESVDISSIISAWRSVIAGVHAGDTAQLPGYYDGSQITYWDGTAWQTVVPTDKANKCRRKGDFRGQYPAPR
ncbi:DUF4157 domain-containing protein [Leptolyngbya cf. ectocarpi LEGE 11479]|uniref:DUF4157 domain-containing protein n=1 Tax=Leptolyngbya cf. ectocarpi LEGE 11479 TaxID=1828722 RepID=A0A928X2N9_LEPEC|nr:DUF4157 domain-containing protein [Leptolyngbya ectocarpi]MBE9066454.1 DUF4157 domain-containing protein [Leptolyngbya cf. ectocarpi LEGE 11479]